MSPARTLFPKFTLEPLADRDLSDTCPPDDVVHIGRFAGVSIVAASEFGIDHPSMLAREFLSPGEGGTVYLHSAHSVVDWFAFAQWTDGRLVLSLSLSPDSSIL